MLKFFSIIHKELLLLWRDKVGLLVLFVLPTILVLFISLIQPNDSLKQQHFKVTLIDQDQQSIGHAIHTSLKKIKIFKTQYVTTRNKTRIKHAQAQIIAGKQQVLIVVPRFSSQHNQDYLRALNDPRKKNIKLHADLKIYIDAALPSVVSHQIENALTIMLQKIQLASLTSAIRQRARAPALHANQDFLTSTTAYLQSDHSGSQKASIAQQNVPAWSLFGMFFIVIPLASVMIRERTQGIGQRLFLTPVSYFTLFSGRFVAFASLNLLQLVLMLVVGVYVLPLLGIAKLQLWPSLGPVLLTGLCAACAATSFGIFLGTILRTQQQASFLGPFIVIIAAALGGIFVPVDMMPSILLHVIKYSPLYWAQSTFLEILVRGSSIANAVVYTQLIKLLTFALCCILLGSLLGKIRKPHTRAMD